MLMAAKLRLNLSGSEPLLYRLQLIPIGWQDVYGNLLDAMFQRIQVVTSVAGNEGEGAHIWRKGKEPCPIKCNAQALVVMGPCQCIRPQESLILLELQRGKGSFYQDDCTITAGCSPGRVLMMSGRAWIFAVLW